MADLSPGALHWLARHHGVIVTSALSATGVGRATRERLSDGPPHDSHPELVLGQLLRERGVPVLNQAPVERAPSRRQAFVDLAVPAVRWGVELDIHPEHETFDGRGRDAHRARELHRADWQIERVVAADMADPRRLADELADCYRRRCDHLRPHPRAK
jgi:very-short-patch-repair endonuclease